MTRQELITRSEMRSLEVERRTGRLRTLQPKPCPCGQTLRPAIAECSEGGYINPPKIVEFLVCHHCERIETQQNSVLPISQSPRLPLSQ